MADPDSATTPFPLKEATSTTDEKAYHEHGRFFTKRSLRPSEYKKDADGTPIIPRLMKERFENEAATLQYIQRATSIPVPKVLGSADVDGCHTLTMNYLDVREAYPMSCLRPEDKCYVREQLQVYLAELHALRFDVLGGVSGLVIPPRRVLDQLADGEWEIEGMGNKKGDYVFCHGDISEDKVLVEPKILEITAIVGWQFAGFYPSFFEKSICGPVSEGEQDDLRLVEFLKGAKV